MLCSTVHDPTRERLTDPLVASVPGRVPEVGAATIGRLVEAADVLWEETCDSFSFAARDRRAGNGSSFNSSTVFRLQEKFIKNVRVCTPDSTQHAGRCVAGYSQWARVCTRSSLSWGL